MTDLLTVDASEPTPQTSPFRVAHGPDSWPRRQLPDGGRGADDRADPRDRRELDDVAGGDARPGRALHGDRSRPAGPRTVGQAPWRLLAGRLRQRHPRSAGRAGPGTRHPGRPLPRRRRGHAVRLPVPGVGRTVGAGRLGRAGQGGQPAPQSGHPARRRVRAPLLLHRRIREAAEWPGSHGPSGGLATRATPWPRCGAATPP